MKKIGIMGGTFNPPHIAHLAMAQWALECLELDEVRFIPTGKIPHKDSSDAASASDRLEMVRLSVKGNPKFSADPIETEREGYSYSYETLEILKKQNPDAKLFFIMGADSLDYLEKWKNPDRIFKCCTVAAISRMGYTDDAMQRKKAELEKQFNGCIELISMPLIEVSSTMLRHMIREGKSLRYLVCDEVMEYIAKNKIYL